MVSWCYRLCLRTSLVTFQQGEQMFKEEGQSGLTNRRRYTHKNHTAKQTGP